MIYFSQQIAQIKQIGKWLRPQLVGFAECSHISRREHRERKAYFADARMCHPDGKHKRSECASVLSAASA